MLSHDPIEVGVALIARGHAAHPINPRLRVLPSFAEASAAARIATTSRPNRTSSGCRPVGTASMSCEMALLSEPTASPSNLGRVTQPDSPCKVVSAREASGAAVERERHRAHRAAGMSRGHVRGLPWPADRHHRSDRPEHRNQQGKRVRPDVPQPAVLLSPYRLRVGTALTIDRAEGDGVAAVPAPGFDGLRQRFDGGRLVPVGEENDRSKPTRRQPRPRPHRRRPRSARAACPATGAYRHGPPAGQALPAHRAAAQRPPRPPPPAAHRPRRRPARRTRRPASRPWPGLFPTPQRIPRQHAPQAPPREPSRAQCPVPSNPNLMLQN